MINEPAQKAIDTGFNPQWSMPEAIANPSYSKDQIIVYLLEKILAELRESNRLKQMDNFK